MTKEEDTARLDDQPDDNGYTPQFKVGDQVNMLPPNKPASGQIIRRAKLVSPAAVDGHQYQVKWSDRAIPTWWLADALSLVKGSEDREPTLEVGAKVTPQHDPLTHGEVIGHAASNGKQARDGYRYHVRWDDQPDNPRWYNAHNLAVIPPATTQPINATPEHGVLMVGPVLGDTHPTVADLRKNFEVLFDGMGGNKPDPTPAFENGAKVLHITNKNDVPPNMFGTVINHFVDKNDHSDDGFMYNVHWDEMNPNEVTPHAYQYLLRAQPAEPVAAEPTPTITEAVRAMNEQALRNLPGHAKPHRYQGDSALRDHCMICDKPVDHALHTLRSGPTPLPGARRFAPLSSTTRPVQAIRYLHGVTTPEELLAFDDRITMGTQVPDTSMAYDADAPTKIYWLTVDGVYVYPGNWIVRTPGVDPALDHSGSKLLVLPHPSFMLLFKEVK